MASSLLAETRTIIGPLIFDRLGLGYNALWLTVWLLVLAAIFLGVISLIAMFCIWWERKVAGHMQSRLGPNRVGPIGILQSLADGLKLLLKEDLAPECADHLLYRLAPYLAFAPVFAAFVALPFGPNLTVAPGLNVGVFWILAMLAVEVMGVILAGWASNNKWAIYGAMRECCQMISYEIPLGIAIIVGVMAAGTLNMVTLGNMQGGGILTWLVFRNPFVFAAFVIYFVASLASNKRAPFDLPESESELVAGFHTEYSGLRWSFFFFAEYGAMFIVGGIQVGLFLGAWHDPFGLIGWWYQRALANYTANATGASIAAILAVNAVALGIFVTKVLTIVFVQMWLRWTLPRPRIDQVLYACVKVLLPLACVLLLGGAVWEWLIADRPGIPWAQYQPWNFANWFNAGYGATLVTQAVLGLVGIIGFSATVGWVVYAATSGRKTKKRLTEPAPLIRAPENLVKA